MYKALEMCNISKYMEKLVPFLKKHPHFKIF